MIEFNRKGHYPYIEFRVLIESGYADPAHTNAKTNAVHSPFFQTHVEIHPSQQVATQKFNINILVMAFKDRDFSGFLSRNIT